MTPSLPHNSLESFRAATAGLAECVRFLTENHDVLNHLPAWIRDPQAGGLDCARLGRLVQLARAELADFDAHLARVRPQQQPESDAEREDDILICCALRFDGYRYLEISGFAAEPVLEQSIATGTFPDNELQRLTLFFLLQRLLFKWGGEREPRDGRHWRLFRELFLAVARCRVPVEFRPQDDTQRLRWRHQFRPRLDETVAFIARIHRATGYRDV